MEGFKLSIQKDGQDYEFGKGDMFAGVAMKTRDKDGRQVLQFLTGEGSTSDLLELLVSMKSMEKHLLSCISSTTKIPPFLLEVYLGIEAEERMKECDGENFSVASINLSQMNALKDFLSRNADEKPSEAPQPAEPDGAEKN